ncbi:hypothetical protein CUZ96_1580 [Enterococcus lactis]|nr:hypothetical protein [Enterococcus lactis]MBL4994033.1 hypothetical protein [Enterococcus lactis]MBL4996381.1 hypothetical protein [Enterococcus lactis]MBL4999490.1 hypothetical protein [Enterococcus lactis]MBL5009732.1 hypothetical protein [Enterococcus lactis]
MDPVRNNKEVVTILLSQPLYRLVQNQHITLVHKIKQLV